MADLKMSLSGLLKKSLVDATCFDFAPLADSDDMVAVFGSAQDARVRNEWNAQYAYILFLCQYSIGTCH